MNTETRRDPLSLATELVLTMLRCPSELDPKKQWEHMKSALEVAASQAETLDEFISTMGRKLLLLGLSNEACSYISLMRSDLSQAMEFEEFRAYVERNAIYVVAIARAEREEARKKK